jgi:hypothetical protein
MNYSHQNITNHFAQYADHFKFAIVAHTNYRAFDKSQRQIDSMIEQTSINCRYAMNCFSKLLYPDATNKPFRYPYLYKPLSFVTIENAHDRVTREQTIHINITLGNVPAVLTAADIETLFRHAWHDNAEQSADVKAYQLKQGTESVWLGYTVKEAQHEKQKAWETNGIWDVQNCWIPHAALKAD